jgi:hypothetical protein
MAQEITCVRILTLLVELNCTTALSNGDTNTLTCVLYVSCISTVGAHSSHDVHLISESKSSFLVSPLTHDTKDLVHARVQQCDKLSLCNRAASCDWSNTAKRSEYFLCQNAHSC